MTRPAHSYTQERTVEFYETDMAGIVHFSNYFRWMESAEHEFFHSLGLELHWHAGEEMHGWARVRAECRYRSPLRYAERFGVQLSVIKKTGTKLGYAVRIEAAPTSDDEPPRLVAEGELEVVHVVRSAGAERMQAAPMPEEVARAIDLAPLPPDTAASSETS